MGRPPGKQHLCKCGCGKQTVKPSHKFLAGHWNAGLKKHGHGTDMCYRLNGCRCELCCTARLEYGQNANLIRRYGITLNDFRKKIKEQDSRCLICSRKIESSAPGRQKGGTEKGVIATHVDHDHVTGKFRGILCFNCNQGLGQFRDNPDVLARAVRYIKSCGRIAPKETTDE